MRKKVYFMLTMLIVLVLSGCGIRSDKSVSTPEAVSDIATGSAVSAIFKNSETTVKEEPLANDYVRIWEVNGDLECQWMVEKLDGTGRKELDRSLGAVLWLTNDWIYCREYNEDDEFDYGTVYRVPFDSGKEPMYDLSKKEVMFQASYLDAGHFFFVTDDAAFYINTLNYDSDTKPECDVLCRYDLQTGETVQIMQAKNGADMFAFWSNNTAETPLIYNNCFFVNAEKALYSVSFDSMEVTKVHDTSKKSLSWGVYVDDTIYTLLGTDIVRLNADGDGFVTILEEKTYTKIFDEMNLDLLCDENATGIYYDINDIYIWNDKMYVPVDVSWFSEETIAEGERKGESIEMSFGRKVLLSADLKDLTRWELDEKLADYFLDNSLQDLYYRTVKTLPEKLEKKQTKSTQAYIENIKDGEVLFYIYKEMDADLFYKTPHLYIYNLDTGDITELDESDWQYDRYELR